MFLMLQPKGPPASLSRSEMSLCLSRDATQLLRSGESHSLMAAFMIFEYKHTLAAHRIYIYGDDLSAVWNSSRTW